MFPIFRKNILPLRLCRRRWHIFTNVGTKSDFYRVSKQAKHQNLLAHRVLCEATEWNLKYITVFWDLKPIFWFIWTDTSDQLTSPIASVQEYGAAVSSKKSVPHRLTTRRQIPEDSNLHNHRRDNHNFHKASHAFL